MKETKVMDKGKHNETEFGELDAVIASALADESFMPAPRPGFEARFEEYRAMNKRRRMFAAFRWSSFAKAAAALVVSVIRKTWYAKYMAAFESAAECTLQIANEQGAAYQRGSRERSRGRRPNYPKSDAADRRSRKRRVASERRDEGERRSGAESAREA